MHKTDHLESVILPEGKTTTGDGLTSVGYWPARAAAFVSEGKYSRAVEVCRENLDSSPYLVSGRLIFGKALFLSGQPESAEEQFRYVLSVDPDNLTALKYLADIRHGQGDETAALAGYRRILEIDPHNRGLNCPLVTRATETTRTISIARGGEKRTGVQDRPLRPIPFYTETMGDLYLAQGHSRLAAAVFRTLIKDNNHPRLQRKLSEAEGKVTHEGS